MGKIGLFESAACMFNITGKSINKFLDHSFIYTNGLDYSRFISTPNAFIVNQGFFTSELFLSASNLILPTSAYTEDFYSYLILRGVYVRRSLL